MARRDSAAAGLEPDGSYSSRKTYSSYGSYGSHHGAAMEPGSQGGARPERSPYQQDGQSELDAGKGDEESDADDIEVKPSHWPWSGRVRRYIYIDFAVYITLLIIFCIATLTANSGNAHDSYNLVQSIQTTLLQEIRPEPEVSFFSINEASGMRAWLRTQFIAVVYGFNPNDPDGLDATQAPTELPSFYLATTSILGPIRLRQLRVQANSCEVDERWTNITRTCHAAYTGKDARFAPEANYASAWPDYPNRATLQTLLVSSLVSSSDAADGAVAAPGAAAADAVADPQLSTPSGTLTPDELDAVRAAAALPPEQFGPPVRDVPAAAAASAAELAGMAQLSEEKQAAVNETMKAFEFLENTQAGPYKGRLINLYREHGFVAELPSDDVAGARAILALLETGNWLDAQTRALFVEFSLYLAPADLLLPVRLVIEVHPTGTTWSDLSLEPLSLSVYTLENRGLLAVQILGLIVAVLAMAWEVWHMRSMRLHTGTRSGAVVLWTVVGVILYLGIVCAVALHIVNVRKAEGMRYSRGMYLPSHELGYFVSVERGVWAVLSFAIWFRLLKFTSQLPKLGILGRTIGRVVPQIAVFFLISCVIFLAFAQCFFMAYYASVEGYQTYLQSIMSVLRFTVLDFDYEALSKENRIITPILFSLLLLIVFFVWVNVMVAIISEVYAQECDRSLKISWDTDFPAMQPNVLQPGNDVDAMVPHRPLRSHPEQVTPPAVALTPDKFERVVLSPVECFSQMITMDVHGHMAALREAAPLEAHEQLDPNRHFTHFSKGHHPWPQHADAPLEAPAGYPVQGTGAQLADVQVVPGAGGAVDPPELQQHAGVYARLGAFVSSQGKSKPTSGRAKRHDCHKDLQALYFDKSHHNLTSARMWYERHKYMFDTRQKLVSHAVSVAARPVKAAVKKTGSSVGAGRTSSKDGHRDSNAARKRAKGQGAASPPDAAPADI